jgi:cystathionine gamma-lyase
MSVVHLLNLNDEIVSIDDVYGGTFRYFSKIVEPRGIKLKTVDFTVSGALESALSNNTKLVWVETPTNPNLKIADIKETVHTVKKRNKNILVVVDNTFATPVFQKPLDMGADLVVHSVTKYLNGHCDVVMGAIAGKDEDLLTRLKFIQNGIGGIPGPFDSYLALRGIKTLHLRMERQEKNAFKVAEFLLKSDKVEKVLFPGLPSHPQHQLAKKQMTGFSGIITFWLKGGIKESRQFLENLQIFSLAESLGGVESLANHPAIMTHASVPPENRQKLGIHDNMVRLSCGIEDADDLIDDLKNAFLHIK